MKFNLITGMLLLFCASAFSQNKTDKTALDNLCGCFDVEFKYAETFSPNENYKYHDRDEISKATELALPIFISKNKVVIQHLLVINDTMIVKHWREDWTYENPVLWKYTDLKTWEKTTLKSEDYKGKWTQTVWEVSDEPRYQGNAKFIAMENEILWTNNTDAPLPRREYTMRDDYNILNRTNRLHISDKGYVHEQDNKKIKRVNGTDTLIVEEKGLNTYVRIADSKCEAAKKYWEKNKFYWESVVKTWDDYLNSHNKVVLKKMVNNKVLFQKLFALLDDYNSGKVAKADVPQKIKAEILMFVE